MRRFPVTGASCRKKVGVQCGSPRVRSARCSGWPRVNPMASRQAPEDEQGGGDPSGDLRSVLVTSVLNLEPLDVDLFR